VLSGRGLLAGSPRRQHISRLDQRASRSNFDSPHHDHFPLRSARFCDVSRADPNFEELSQSTVIAFMDAITMTAWSFRQRLGPTKSCLYPQVMAYPTLRPRSVASLDGLLRKGKLSGHGADGRRSH
jgi:hypothetical protein